jgi:hypothetical protein
MEEIEPLAEGLRLVVGLDPQSLLGMERSQAPFQIGQDVMGHVEPNQITSEANLTQIMTKRKSRFQHWQNSMRSIKSQECARRARAVRLQERREGRSQEASLELASRYAAKPSIDCT